MDVDEYTPSAWTNVSLFVRYYCRVMSVAFSHSASAAQTVIFGTIILLGGSIWLLPRFAVDLHLADWVSTVSGWKVAAATFGSIVGIRLLLAPFWIHRETERSLERNNSVAAAQNRHTEAIKAQTEEMRLAREQKEQKSNPISQYMQVKQKAALDAAMQRNKANTLAYALRIEFGTGDDYDRIEHFDKTSVLRRFMYVSIHNEGDGYLTECKLSVRSSIPGPVTGSIPAILVSDIKLNRAERVFIPVAGFTELPGAPKHPLNDYIILSTRLTSLTTSTIYTSLAAAPIEDPAIITLEASALECRSHSLHMRVWVDRPSRRLRAEVI